MKMRRVIPNSARDKESPITVRRGDKGMGRNAGEYVQTAANAKMGIQSRSWARMESPI